MKRYERHRPLLGETAWDRLTTTRCVVVGAGGLGSTVILLLSRLGPVTIEVWDPATIDLPDLNRQVLYTQYDVGKWKALQAARQVESINPDVRVQPVTESLTAARFSAHHDRAEDESFVLFDCLDTMVSRAELAEIAVRQPAPIFHGGVERWYGQVATLLPDGSGYEGLFGAGWSEQDAPSKPIMPFVVTTIASTMVGEFTHWLESPAATPLSSRVAYFDGKRMVWRMIDSSGRL